MLRIYVVYDDDEGLLEEERSSYLIAAEGETQAIDIWRKRMGYCLEEGQPCARLAEWQWGRVPAPVPTEPGVWWDKTRTEFGAMFRGFGYWEDGDPSCDECGEHVDAGDIVEGEDETGPYGICRWCHVEK